MKSLFSLSKICFSLAFMLFAGPQLDAQWTGFTIQGDSYRTGNTGIGISAPQTKLHLYKGSKGTTLLRLHQYDAAILDHSLWDMDLDKYGSYTINSSSNPSGTFTNRFTILRKGFVGIGTLTPEHKLQVIGDTDVADNLFVGERIGIGTQTPDQHLSIFDADTPTLRFEREGSKWDYEIRATGGGNLVFRGGGDGTGDNGNGYWGDKMVITGRGRVGIGMSNVPGDMVLTNANGDDYLLYVKGGIRTEEVKVETGWCDYVFEEDYDLLPLEAVEDHIAAKGHLHNTPSAKVIESEGLELKAMTVNQQEKIEELFLHVIDLNKQLKALQAENELLKSQVNKSAK